MVNAQKESLLRFGREQDLKGERGKSTYWCMPIVLSLLFFLNFLSSFLCFLSYLFPFFFLFSFTLFSFYSMNTLYFSIPFSGHGKGPFIVPTMTSFLLLCPLTAFVWSGRTC